MDDVAREARSFIFVGTLLKATEHCLTKRRAKVYHLFSVEICDCNPFATWRPFCNGKKQTLEAGDKLYLTTLTSTALWTMHAKFVFHTCQDYGALAQPA